MQRPLNIASALRLGLHNYVLHVISQEDDSRVILSCDDLPTGTQGAVLPFLYLLEMFKFGNDVFSKDWASTLHAEKYKNLNTPEELLQLAWFGIQLDHQGWVKKAQYMGFEVTATEELEEDCFCVYKKNKPHVFKYKRKEEDEERDNNT